jgi:hypothetical protein
MLRAAARKSINTGSKAGISLAPWVRSLSSADRPTVCSVKFWSDRSTWSRAAVNTTRCLVGCSAGDMGMMALLGVWHPETAQTALGIGLCVASGITTSVILETTYLRSREGFDSVGRAFRAACGMSMVSMVTMEMAMTLMELWLTGGVPDPRGWMYWAALGPSLGVGFAAPLPYSYYQLKRHGRACH